MQIRSLDHQANGRWGGGVETGRSSSMGGGVICTVASCYDSLSNAKERRPPNM